MHADDINQVLSYLRADSAAITLHPRQYNHWFHMWFMEFNVSKCKFMHDNIKEAVSP